MVIYEMIYHFGPDDYLSDFYEFNNKKSRSNFYKQILDDAKKALSDFLAQEKANIELDNYLISNYEQDIEVLKSMKSDFINNGKANSGSYVGICIAERIVKQLP
ncbi:hypothetical protein [Acinetobacter calcoaceticus]|uniref:hypothetical protein n=1 Tax=Acinetobacter calcoaceticus TaxID=471 RepID=UPI0018DDFC6B|nr:hypothetical protein [Acinetobacter calcoaceticus]